MPILRKRMLVYLITSILVFSLNGLFIYMGIYLACLKSTLLNNIPFMVGQVNILGAVKVFFTVVISEFLLLDMAVLGGTKPTDLSSSPVKLFDRNLGAGRKKKNTFFSLLAILHQGLRIMLSRLLLAILHQGVQIMLL